MLSGKVRRQWTTSGTVPTQSFENGTDDRHAHYNFHKRIEFVVNKFVNLYLHNLPSDYPMFEDQLHKLALKAPLYLTVVHTTSSSLNDLKNY
eukprot:5475152-Amphidinium_carterae.3